MNKAYQRINWENYPSIKTPLNEENLNKMDLSVNEIDNRVISLDTTKAEKIELSNLFNGVAFNEKTGIITFNRVNGGTVTIDTALEKIATGIYYDPVTEKLTLPLIDGTKMEVDLSRLITEYNFLDSDTIAFSVTGGKVKAIVKDGSISERHLRPNYLADIRVESSNAAASAAASAQSATNSASSAKLSESWAVGSTGVRTGEDTNNSKFYSELSKSYRDESEQYAGSAQDAVIQINKKLELAEFSLDDDGNLIYTDDTPYLFDVDDNGMLNWEVA